MAENIKLIKSGLYGKALSKITKGYMNPERIEVFQEHKKRWYKKKEVAAIIVATIMLWLVVQPYIVQKMEYICIYQHASETILVHIDMM